MTDQAAVATSDPVPAIPESALPPRTAASAQALGAMSVWTTFIELDARRAVAALDRGDAARARTILTEIARYAANANAEYRRVAP
jgi:hypothetical protein